MRSFDALSDEDLLVAARREPEAFAVFYRRHLSPVLGFVHARTRDREVAADLTAEVFAAALGGAGTFRPRRGPARAWLYAIARNTITDSVRRGQVEDRARRRLGLRPLELTDDDLARVDELLDEARGHTPATDALAVLASDARDAVVARVVEEREYDEIATELRCSPSVVRKRVSRGLAELRGTVEDPR